MKTNSVLQFSFGFIVLFGILVESCAPKTAEACIKRTKWHGNLEKKEALYQKALGFDSTKNLPYDWLGWHYANGDSSSTAKSRFYFSKLIELDSTQSVAWFGFGYTYITNSRQSKAIDDRERYYKKAIPYISKAIDLDSTQYAYYFQRGTCYYLTSNYFAAAKDFTKACELGQETACLAVRKDSTGRYVDNLFNPK